MTLHNRFIRVLTLAAMSGSSFILGGGALVTTAGPSSAAPGGTNVCSSAVGTSNFFTGAWTETLSGCHQQGSATVDHVAQTPSEALVTIHWATGNATSHVIASGVVTLGAPCAAAEVADHVTLRVIDGPYAGSIGHNVTCNDISRFPIISWTNLGPIVI